MRKRLNNLWEKLKGAIMQQDEVVLIGQLTLFMFALYGPEGWLLLPLYQIALLGSFVFPNIIRSPVLWILVTAGTGFTLMGVWATNDNHMWLMLYWALSFTVATIAARYHIASIRNVLQHNAIFLLVFIMGMSVVQKVISGGYLDGSFFEYTLLTDVRFFSVTHYLGGLSPVDLFANQSALHDIGLSPTFTLITSSSVTVLALIITYYVLIIELVIALLFSVKKDNIRLLAHVILGVFIVTVYVVAPVYSFGILLSILGIAAITKYRAELTSMYLGLIVLLCLYQIPWITVVYVLTGAL